MKAIIFLFLAAVFAGVIALYGLFGEDTSENQSGTDSVSETVVVDEVEQDSDKQIFSGEGTLQQVQALGVAVECLISYDSPDLLTPVIGTYFVNGKKIRGDFEMVVPELGGSMLSSVIFDDDGVSYFWSVIDGVSYGAKISGDMDDNVESDSVREPVPDDVNVSYECKEVSEIDNSIFEPPSDVLFQDVSNVLDSGMEYGTIYEEGEF